MLWYIPSALSADALRMLHWKDQLKCRSGEAWGCWPNALAPSCVGAVGQLHLPIILSGRSSDRLWALVLDMQYENQYKNR